MSTISQPISAATTIFANGASAQVTFNQSDQVIFSGTWVANDNWTIILTDALTGLQTQVGYGFEPGVSQLANAIPPPVFAFTYGDKEYVLQGSTAFFSAVGESTVFNDPNASGDSFVNMGTNLAQPDNLTGMATYQGQLVFFTRRTCQIWVVDANPANWQQVQVFSNIGTFAPASIQSVGDLDVLFLSDSGYRSLRARVAVLNAFVADVGSPIDDLVLDALSTGTATSNAAACSIVEPTANRYWGYLNGTIYVWSAFPSNKIEAWSTYLPTYQNGTTQTAFTPTKFTVFQGQVFALGSDSAIYQHGGPDNNSYDNCVLTVQTPFHDLKSPTMMKTSKDIAVDVECDPYGKTTAQFNIQASSSEVVDPSNPQWTPVIVPNATGPTFDLNKAPFTARGTHFAMLAVTRGTGPAILSALALNLQ